MQLKCKVIKKWQPLHYLPFLAKLLVPPPPLPPQMTKFLEGLIPPPTPPPAPLCYSYVLSWLQNVSILLSSNVCLII